MTFPLPGSTGEESGSVPPDGSERVSGPNPDELEPDAPSPIRLLAQFFVVPLGIVGACVAVFYLFGALTIEKKDPEQLLAEVRGSADSTRRWQAAFQLSRTIDGALDPARRQELAAKIIPVFNQVRTDDEETRKIRRYLALVLGKLRSEAATPALVEAFRDPDGDTRLYSLWAVGMIGDRSAAADVAAFCRSDDSGLRKMAAYVIGQLGDRSHAAELVTLLEDAHADVRWNAALALGELGDIRGLDVLKTMLDRQALEKEKGIRPDQVESAMTGAIGAIAKLNDRASIPAFQKLSAGDVSLKVRDASRRALETLK